MQKTAELSVTVSSSAPVAGRPWMATSLIVLALFVLVAAAGGILKPLTNAVDELAHLSYVARAQSAVLQWPRFADMRMLDPQTFQFGDEPNYLNHPPFYYWLMAALGPNLIGEPQSLFPARVLNIAMTTFGLASLLLLARRMQMGRNEFYAFVAMIVSTPVLAPLASSVNNDNLGFFAGGLALLGLYAYASSFKRVWLVVACCGLLAAGAAKLTALLLVGTTLVLMFALMSARNRLSRLDWLVASVSLVIAASPYLVFVFQYGSPAPNTAAQQALLTSGASTAGWSDAPRMGPLTYAGFFLKVFLMDWIPMMRGRGAVQLLLLVVPATIVLMSLAGYGVSIRALLERRARPSDLFVVAGMSAIALTLAIHIAFSYQRHLQTGWMRDTYPRYYLPLAAIIPIAALTASSTVQQSSLRTALIAFLVVAPIVVALVAWG